MKTPTVTADQIIQRIKERLQVLGNKTHSDKLTDAERTAAGQGARELAKILNWVKFGGRNKQAKDAFGNEMDDDEPEAVAQ